MISKNLKSFGIRWWILPGIFVLIGGFMACSKKNDDKSSATGSVSITFQK